MNKLLILKWLPASGKTTYAKDLVENYWYKRVNKDELRAMIDNSNYSKKNENLILKIRDNIVENYLISGYNVVVDDTNFCHDHIETLKLVAFNAWLFLSKEVPVEIKFIDTPLYECIERDSKREEPVWRRVIMEMYRKYIWLYNSKEMPEKPDEKLPYCVICDIDWTLAYSPQRSPYDYNLVYDDLPNENLILIIDQLTYTTGVKLFIFSGRDDDSKIVTEKWLDKHWIEYEELVMRKTGDKRSDEIVKKEMYEKYIKGKYNVLTVFDDRPRVIRMWKEQKLMVCDVNRQDPRIDF